MPVSFDLFYSYDELTALLHAWAEARPELVQVESMGQSYEGRDIWLVTLTNAETGPSIEKPGFLIEANIHSVEWTGSTAALHLIQRLVDGYGSDEKVTRLLDTRTMYVVPRLNPDGAEHALQEGRFIRSSVRPYPTSEPEVRAMVQAVTERPNITGHIAYHTFSGVHLRPYAGRPDEEFPTQDLRAYKIIGERGTELTGYPAVSVFHDFKYDPKMTIKGGAHDWMYDHLGVFSWTTEFWSPQRQAGLEDYHYTDWIREHPIEDDVALIRWARERYPDAHVDWYEYDHPELGKVELGGWDIINYWFNVPFDQLESEVAPHSEFALFHALISPLLEVRSLDVDQLGETSFLVRLVLQNSGWLPTNVSEKAVERKAVRDLEVELELPEGARLVGGDVKTEVGQLKGRVDKRSTTWWANDESTSDLAKLEWVVEASAGTEIGLTAGNLRAGTIRRTLKLEA